MSAKASASEQLQRHSRAALKGETPEKSTAVWAHKKNWMETVREREERKREVATREDC
ncbi:hypothetical protein GLOTRDRAFT_134674 [Gloeophyllum trabeum ATCC 11539]|uniref:Uncharacterized protein n=1 Tax=Gloeophyllum trabeum (strain ATCC 11539 / FP-39264 / Madison 617) TaxID=670483 RepID=S7PQU6_GLOTA|nr:uncharacterized protein GLOTRDRAFT_134674 [Gloeophyllum trabeum ATCC 11539]EPQ49737.1 hypothetical protein GLOTRDRAFT_134674 [Gloeophyllum trabeum ATCC 11539]